MARNSKISWTDHTVNLWWGCSKVHTGCKNCYAENLASSRFGMDIWGEHSGRKLIKSAFTDLAKYQKEAHANNTQYRIFMGSMMDIFEQSKPLLNPEPEQMSCAPMMQMETGHLRQKLFAFILANHYPNLKFLFLTKRPQNIESMVPSEWLYRYQKNIWVGTSISDAETAKQLVPVLRNQSINCRKFLSIEPQVGPIDDLDLTGIHWVIQGGESGPNKRPFDLSWAYRMKDICAEQNVPFHFKQIDKVQPVPEDLPQEFPNFS